MQFSQKFKVSVLELYHYPQLGRQFLPHQLKQLPEMLEAGDPTVASAIERIAREHVDIALGLPAEQVIAAIKGQPYKSPDPSPEDLKIVHDMAKEDGISIGPIEYTAERNRQSVLAHFERQAKAEVLLAEFDAMLDVEEAKEALRGQLGPSCRSFIRHKREPGQ